MSAEHLFDCKACGEPNVPDEVDKTLVNDRWLVKCALCGALHLIRAADRGEA